MTLCAHCHEPLQFHEGEGWRHQDGKLYKQREVKCRRCGGAGTLNGEVGPYPSCRYCAGMGRILVDDHCALPVVKA